MALEEAGVQLIAQGIAAYLSDMKSATSATSAFVDGTEQGGGKVNAAGQVMIGALRQIGTIAVDAFAQAAKATVGFLKDSVSVAGDFEQGMKKFQAVAGKGVDTKGLDQFRTLFIQLGKELPVSTSEVEQAAIEMVSGGIDPAIVAGGALRQTLNFAAASGLSLADAAATSAKFLAGWTKSSATTQEKVDFLTLSTDTLTKAAAASSTTAAELRLGLFNTQGAAQALGVTFEDTTASLALLAPAFQSSAQAGTALNVFMTRLVPSTIPATDAMKALGIITKSNQNLFFDSQGTFLGMANAAQVLKDKMSGLTDEQKISELHTLFGNDAMKVGNLLLQDGAAAIDGMKAKMADANGVLATAQLMHEGYNTALENAKGSVEALQITIGSALLPILTDLMNNVIAPAVNTLTDMADAVFGNQEAFDRLSPTLQGVVSAIDTVVADTQEIIGAFDEAGAMSSEFGESIGRLASDLGLPGELIQDIVFAIQDLVAWFSTASDKSQSLGKAVVDLSGIWTLAGKVVGDVMSGYQAVANAVLPQITQFVAAHGTQISAFFKTTWDSIISIITLALKLYDSIVPPILNAVAGFITAHGSEIQKVLTGAWNVITSVITGTLDTIKGVMQLALDVINGDWDKAWQDIQAIIDAQVKAIGGIVSGFFTMIAGLFNTSMGDILKTWQNNWNMALEIVSKIDWKQVGTAVVNGIIAGVESAAGSLMSTLKNLASDALQAAKDALGISSPSKEFAAIGAYSMQGIMVGMESMLPALIDVVNATGAGMIDALKKNISKAGDAIRKQMADLEADIKDIGKSINDAIADSFGATASIDRQMADNLDKLKDVLPDYQQFVQGALKQVQQEALKFADPAEGAKYFKMRSAQILEMAKLQKDLSEETDQAERARIIARMNLINSAQIAEISQSETQQRGQTAPKDDIAAQIAALFQTNDVARSLPGILQSEIIAQITSLMQQLQNAQPPGYVAPPASAAQQSSWQAPSSTNSSQRTYNMPIYTNNTPAALQQSLAIAQAVMP